ncbi:MAG: DUF4157 domain-containing protein [Bacteroidota bacterium]
MESPKEENIQRSETEVASEEEPVTEVAKVQRSTTANDGGETAPEEVNEVVNSSGQSLDNDVREDMEGQLGGDLSDVRVHTDEKAASSAAAISAEAYTYGNHIVFGAGKYAPKTPEGRELMAHEMVHVQQQSGQIQRRVAEEGVAPSVATPASPAPITDESGTVPAATAAPAAPASTEESLESAPGALPVVNTIEPLMPPPPENLSPAARSRGQNVRDRTEVAGDANATLPPAEETTSDARAGVTEPTEETDARAAATLTSELNDRLAPSPEIEELCENIRRVIREKRPPDEDSLLQADPEEAANEAGDQLNEQIDEDVERVEGEYDELDTAPAGTPEQIGEAPVPPPTEVPEPATNAASAAPDALSEEEVSLDADLESVSTQMEDAGMNSPAGQIITDGPVAEARSAETELAETAAEDPAAVLAAQDEALTNARADLADLQDRAFQALENSRATTVTDSGGQQLEMVGSEEDQRRILSERAETLFTDAQDAVNTILEPLSGTAMEMWETGKARIATEFEDHLARVQSWVDERYSGAGGGVVELWDDLTGMPDWVTDEYNDAEETFGDDICDLIREISLHVNGVVATCEEIIDNANTAIREIFDNAPAELQEWAQGQQAIFQGRIDGLRESVRDTQQKFNRDLVNRASAAVQEVREQVHALREEAKGLIGRAMDALAEFLEDPARAIINGLLSLVGIEPARFWALIARIETVVSDISDDPEGFANNLLQGIGDGFQQFFDNFGEHFFEGLINWLFSGLGQLGIEIPGELSLKSIMTFFLQLMGITWDRIKELLARHIGEENVALIEQAYEIVSELIELGPEGVFEMLKDKLDPQNILDTIIQMAVDFVIEALITQATVRIIAMFNPVGAIYQAIEAIYKVMKWIFENAARIFTLVETVVDGIAEIVAGNLGAVANLVENALAQLMVPVIDFVAEFIGLGGLPDKVADAVRGLQEWVEGILDRVIGFLADQARALLRSLGIGEDEDPEAEDEEEEELEDDEVGETVRFTADGESHRIWIDTTGSGVTVMMASNAAPMEDQIQELKDIAAQKNIDDADALIAAVEAKHNELKAQAAITEELMSDATDEDVEAGEVDEAEDADDTTERLQRELATAMQRAIEAINPPMPSTPIYQNDVNGQGIPEYVHAEQITDANKRTGSRPASDAIPDAWNVIRNFGVNENSWVRFHILNQKLGGMGTTDNLVPTTGNDNGRYERSFETHLKTAAKTMPIWFTAAITYYGPNVEFPGSDYFSNSYVAEGGQMKYQNGQWVKDAENEFASFSFSPGLPSLGVFPINDLLQDNDPVNLEIFLQLTPITRKLYQELKRVYPAGGYQSVAEINAVTATVYGPSPFRTRLENAIVNFSGNWEF